MYNKSEEPINYPAGILAHSKCSTISCFWSSFANRKLVQNRVEIWSIFNKVQVVELIL
jgi:hypothetical protein